MSNFSAIAMHPVSRIPVIGSAAEQLKRVQIQPQPNNKTLSSRCTRPFTIECLMNKLNNFGDFLYKWAVNSFSQFLRRINPLYRKRILYAQNRLVAEIIVLSANKKQEIESNIQNSKYLKNIATLKNEIQIREKEIASLKTKIEHNKNLAINLGNKLHKYDEIIEDAKANPELKLDTKNAVKIARETALKIQNLHNQIEEFKGLIPQYEEHIKKFKICIQEQQKKHENYIQKITQEISKPYNAAIASLQLSIYNLSEGNN